MNITIEQVRDFLYREARLLDDKSWDEWLTCYASDAVFWMPAWDDDGTLTTDPEREISLIYYGSKAGLEDRVFRIKTERSSASTPEPRTAHMIANVEFVTHDADATADARRGGAHEVKEDANRCTVRFNWQTLSYRYKTTDSYFGTSHYELDISAPVPVIKRKYVVLKNDYIHHVVDVYHI